MAGTNVFDGDLVVRGTLKASAFQPPNGSIGNNQVGSADPIDASKLKHQYLARLVQPSGSSATAVTQAVHHAHAAGSVVGVEVGAVVAATGADTVTVDVKKNGTTVLSGVVTLDSSTAAYAAVLGAVAVTAYAAGDTFTAVVTPAHSTGTLPQGLFVSLVLREGAD